MLDVVVVGAGTMGSVHARAYERMQDIRLVGIVDVNTERAERLAIACHTEAYQELDNLLSTKHVDVVDVCVPTDLHRSYAEKAFQSGKHVICEKPIARTLEDAVAMLHASQTAGKQLHIGHVLRFFPEYQVARELVRRGELGEVGTAHAVRGGQFPKGVEDWYSSTDRSGTLILDMMIHDFDFLRWCFGEIRRVYAKNLRRDETERLDHAFVTLRFDSEVIAQVTGTWAYPEGFHTSLEIAGQYGTLRHDSNDSAPMQVMLHDHSAGAVGVAVPESPLLKDPYFAELEHFMACIRGEAQPIMTGEDALAALTISLAALESVRTGRVISLDKV